MIKVLFVCLGNICRSPLAQGILKKKIQEAGLEDEIQIDSCGTSQYHIGEQPDPRTVKNAKMNGVFLYHKARQFASKDFKTFDYILFMDSANLNCVRRLDHKGEFSDKLYLMRDFDPEDKGADVPDPFFGGDEGFQHVFEMLERSVDTFLNYIVKRYDLRVEVD